MATASTESGAQLPGGVGVSHVRVYDSVGPDGLRGGSPHLHTVCSEAYLVIAGHGMVQTLSSSGYSEVPLSVGTITWFTPGTVHRLVNIDGRLELYVVMSNAGLPEAGDLVLAFEPELLADAGRYRAAAILPADARTTDGADSAAMARRDLAVTGFAHWRGEVDRLGPEALGPLHRAAAGLVADTAPSWAAFLEADPAEELARSRSNLAALIARDDPAAMGHLAAADVHSYSLLVPTRRYGCCGTLGTLMR